MFSIFKKKRRTRMFRDESYAETDWLDEERKVLICQIVATYTVMREGQTNFWPFDKKENFSVTVKEPFFRLEVKNIGTNRFEIRLLVNNEKEFHDLKYRKKIETLFPTMNEVAELVLQHDMETIAPPRAVLDDVLERRLFHMIESFRYTPSVRYGIEF